MDSDTIPLLYDIFQKHYPQLIGQVLVLNYGWLHAGIWAMIRPILTAEAQSRLVFIEHDRIEDYIDRECIPTDYHGTALNFNVEPEQCPILMSFGSLVPLFSDSLAFKDLFARLVDHSPLHFHTPLSSHPDVFYDAPPMQELGRDSQTVPRTVRSAADLQSLLKGSSLRRSYSQRSFSNMAQLRLSALESDINSSPTPHSLPDEDVPEDRPSMAVVLLNALGKFFKWLRQVQRWRWRYPLLTLVVLFFIRRLR